MKLQLASDLHLEFYGASNPDERLIHSAAEAELLVLAGDIGVGTRAIGRFLDWPVPVIYLAGNHEFYRGDFYMTRAKLRERCAGTNIKFLDDEETVFNGVRLLGSTMWTDYKLAATLTQAEQMAYAEQQLNDHRLIVNGRDYFTAADALAQHLRSRAWLEAKLAEPFSGKTVVVTHHGPSPQSVHPRYSGDPLNAAFNSNLEALMPQVNLWLHGHVHDSFDYKVGECRVVANPAGYATGARGGQHLGGVKLENAAFQRELVIEV